MLKMLSNRQARKLFWHFDVLTPLVLWCLVALFYSSLTFGCRLTPVVAQQNQFCYLGNITFDNVLPRRWHTGFLAGALVAAVTLIALAAVAWTISETTATGGRSGRDTAGHAMASPAPNLETARNSYCATVIDPFYCSGLL